MARLSEWIEARQIGVVELNPLVVEAFLADRHARKRSVAVRGGAFVPLLEFLRVRSVLPSVDGGLERIGRGKQGRVVLGHRVMVLS